MKFELKSIRTFIGSKEFKTSREFYSDLGFEEKKLSNKLSYFKSGYFGFYLQDLYVKDWIDNAVIFIEVEDLKFNHTKIKGLCLEKTYKDVVISNIQSYEWGNNFFIKDPSGVLLSVVEFNKAS